MDLGPEDYLIYETFFEDDGQDVNSTAGCCSTLIVLALIFIIVNIVIA